ncbi:MAG: polyphosphate polymerase domain-containing protein [Bacteroidales bacterium]|nr:polyphosphate polymerase domain-containing protein [Bacteroidales bacterium]
MRNSFASIKSLLSEFKPISLSQMDSVKLLQRSEKKYILHSSKVASVLKKAIADYVVLEICDQRLQEYSTEYFDTIDNAMYLAHHNGKPSRYKVRKREYVVSGEQFLEVKRRTTNGETLKKRVELNGDEEGTVNGDVFIQAVTPYKLEGLEKKLVNSFYRITLVNTALKERVTIDMGLKFSNGSKTIQLPSVAIVEIKSESAEAVSGFEVIMKSLRIHPSSVSKYCIGRALLEPKLKANLFQNKIRYLIKLNKVETEQSSNVSTQ